MLEPKDSVLQPRRESNTIEKIYQKKSQLEHILLRPDTYIGSVEKTKELMWVFDEATNSMVQRNIEYVPGLYKIFDEILVNAADNKQRDQTMNCIRVDIDAERNIISVWNNGEGIPVAMHKEEQMFVPTMIFGHLLTSSNYNDEEAKVTGGRNGYGAKLCNIFSKKFVVETASSKYKQQFKQTWADNMSKASEPHVKSLPSGTTDFTKVTFSPDLSKFKMDRLDEDIVALMTRRAYDVAASTRGVRVFLNGNRLSVKSFRDYVDLYLKEKEEDDGSPLKVVHEVVNERWEVAITSSDRGFQQVSFVNSIATTKGGRHVDYVTDMIVKQLIEVLKKKNKGGVNIKPFQVKNHLWIFVNCLIVNPTFDSQTKEHMTLQSKSFGSKCELSDKFTTGVLKCGVVESVLTWAKFKAQSELAKATGGKKQSRLRGIPKLEDANDAGTRSGVNCTLILTEGDSAKSLAVSGLAVVGRDKYGVFPLRGKLLNVREATHKQILENAEINNLIKIIGLQYKRRYEKAEDVASLRYGKLMIMTDQDQDGSHIKGLIINFLHHNWPELLRMNFLEQFITPIVKATRGSRTLSFYSLPEYEQWKRETLDHARYSIKYYKGLGTSTAKEAKEYFQNMERHRIRFKYGGRDDDSNILMAFSRKTIDLRKDWLLKHMADCRRRAELGLPDKYLYGESTKFLTYSDFINDELVLYSNSDNIRSIPSLVDGLKPGQRKVLFTCFKRNDRREVKVAQLAGSVAEHSAYHHGEQSLCATIINLAQNYVGSNNINLLQPNGQFGTRLCGGKDAASPRYIFTMMSTLTRLIFNPSDDPLLKYQRDDNQRIEPNWYIPILPMVLVNGAEGIGTGWSTKIPNYNPREIVENLRRMLEGEEPKEMLPWYKNFKGTIIPCGDDRYAVNGEIGIIGTDKVEITELPIGVWTQVYKENVLELMLHGSEKTKAVLADYKEYNTDTTVKFVVTVQPGMLENMEREGLHKVFKLQTAIQTSNMVLFDELSYLRRYESVETILKEFYEIRLRMYAKRKEYMEGSLEAEANRLTYQAKFIVEKCNGTITVENKRRAIIVQELIKLGYPRDPLKEWKERVAKEEEEKEDEQEVADEEQEEETEDEEKKPKEAKEQAVKSSDDVKNFDYLLGMSMWMLTNERKAELLKQRDNKVMELELLRRKTPSDLWKDDLNKFIEKLDEVEEREKRDEAGLPGKKNSKAAPKRRVKEEVLPSPVARRVAPTVEEFKKKVAKSKELKEKKITKEKVSPKEEEVDEFDLLVKGNTKTLKDKLGTSPEKEKKGRRKKNDGLKQTKLNFKPVSKDKKDSDNEDSDDSVVTASKRTKNKKINYSFGSENNGSDSSDEELFENKLVKDTKKMQQKLLTDSEEEIKRPAKKRLSSDDHDLIIEKENIEPKAKVRKTTKTTASVKSSDEKSSESTQNERKTSESDGVVFDADIEKEKEPKISKMRKLLPVATKAEDKPKSKPTRKQRSSDDETRKTAKTKSAAVEKPKRGRKKRILSDSNASDSDFIVDDTPEKVKPSKRTARNAKPVSYTVDISDSE